MPSRVAGLIRYFVERVPGAGRTRIAKFLYMADYESRRYLGRPLTDLEYRWDNHGPYDPEILRQIHYLDSNGDVREEKYRQEYVFYKYYSTGTRRPFPFRKEELSLLEHVVSRYAKMGLDSLLEDVVYQTRPMLEVSERGELLRMHLVDNEARIPGLELERMVKAFDELEAGGGTALEEVWGEDMPCGIES